MYPLYYMALHGDYFLVPPQMWENLIFPQLPGSAWERAGKDDDPGDRLPRPRQHLQQHHQQHPEGLYPLYLRWLIFFAPKADGLTAIEMFMIVNIIFVFCALIGIKTAWIQCQCVIVKILSEYAVILFSQKIKTSQRPKIRKAAMRSSTEVCKWWRLKRLSSDLKAKTPPRFKVRLWGWTWTATAPWPRGRCWRPKNSHQRRWTMIISILGNNSNIYIWQQW